MSAARLTLDLDRFAKYQIRIIALNCRFSNSHILVPFLAASAVFTLVPEFHFFLIPFRVVDIMSKSAQRKEVL